MGRTAEPRAACRGSRACVPAPPPPAPGCMGSQELGDTGGELSPLPAKCAAASVPSGVSRRRPRCPHPSAPRAASDACGQRWFVSPASGCRVAPGTSSQAAPGGRGALTRRPSPRSCRGACAARWRPASAAPSTRAPTPPPCTPALTARRGVSGRRPGRARLLVVTRCPRLLRTGFSGTPISNLSAAGSPPSDRVIPGARCQA